MGSWRPLVLTILLYVTLDLSLASMPGAFVFDAEDSVESVQMSRVRPFPTLTIAPVPAPVPKDVDVNVRPQPIPRPVPPPPIRRGETSRAPAFKLSDLSEDPH